jgi:hypothetical protein
MYPLTASDHRRYQELCRACGIVVVSTPSMFDGISNRQGRIRLLDEGDVDQLINQESLLISPEQDTMGLTTSERFGNYFSELNNVLFTRLQSANGQVSMRDMESWGFDAKFDRDFLKDVARMVNLDLLFEKPSHRRCCL